MRNEGLGCRRAYIYVSSGRMIDLSNFRESKDDMDYPQDLDELGHRRYIFGNVSLLTFASLSRSASSDACCQLKILGIATLTIKMI